MTANKGGLFLYIIEQRRCPGLPFTRIIERVSTNEMPLRYDYTFSILSSLKSLIYATFFRKDESVKVVYEPYFRLFESGKRGTESLCKIFAIACTPNITGGHFGSTFGSTLFNPFEPYLKWYTYKRRKRKEPLKALISTVLLELLGGVEPPTYALRMRIFLLEFQRIKRLGQLQGQLSKRSKKRHIKNHCSFSYGEKIVT